MRLHIQFLQQGRALRRALQRDGWKFANTQAAHTYASHPEAPNESSARNRLARLGLLTSSLLRIEFEHHTDATGPGLRRRDQQNVVAH
jgi:hypothetical protein